MNMKSYSDVSELPEINRKLLNVVMADRQISDVTVHDKLSLHRELTDGVTNL